MPPQEIPATQDAPLPGGLGWVALEPVSHSSLLAHTAEARAQDTWNALLEDAWAGLTGQGRQATSDEAPGRLAYVEPPLGAPHSPDLCHGQPAWSQAGSAPMAAHPRA